MYLETGVDTRPQRVAGGSWPAEPSRLTSGRPQWRLDAVRGAWVCWPWLVVMVLAGCAGGKLAPVSEGRDQPPPDTYVIRKGDTLYSIAWRYSLDYRDVAAWNRIHDPDRIFAGQRLHLKPMPKSSARRVAAPAAPPTATVKPARASLRKDQVVNADGSREGKLKAVARDAIIWSWPTHGRVTRTFSAAAPGKKGLDIAGTLGQPIQAAAGGKVVYSGEGLIGYGRLIIIKHNDTFLSAYAYNDTLLVNEGEWVRPGQHIAAMGSTGTNNALLHFQIRRDGTPVDPMRYLPQRP